MSRSARIVLAIGSLVVLAGCVTAPSVETPRGFASYEPTEVIAAVSPEGVGFRLRAVDNDPIQSLGFWSEALSRHMTDSGYLLYAHGDFTCPAGPGEAFEWVAPVGEVDWIYLTAIVVAGERILIAESAGPVDVYRERRAAVVAALGTISVSEPTLGGGP